MPEIQVTATEESAPSNLINFLKAIPNGRSRRGVLYPQWFLLLVAALGILSGCRSSRALELFARQPAWVTAVLLPAHGGDEPVAPSRFLLDPCLLASPGSTSLATVVNRVGGSR